MIQLNHKTSSRNCNKIFIMSTKDIAELKKMAASIIINKKDPEVKPGGLDKLNVQIGFLYGQEIQ